MRLPDWILAICLALLTCVTLLWSQQVRPRDLTLTVEERHPQGPPAEPNSVTIYARWRWSTDPPSDQDYLVVVAESEGWQPTGGWTGLDSSLLEGLGIHGQAWAFPIRPSRSGEERLEFRLIGQRWGAQLPLRVYYLHWGAPGGGPPGSTWVREVRATVSVR